MRIVMFTNTYLPHVGGVARSVDAFARAYRARGHEVLVVAPMFDGQAHDEAHVLRVPAIQNFNGSDFSVVLPVNVMLSEFVEAFAPDIVHAHHPFLLGNSALRVARVLGVPLTFTHHTLYERYTHYVPMDSVRLKRFAIELATSYANACDLVFAPSASIKALLQERGVTTPIEALPTGVDQTLFGAGCGKRARRACDVPESAYVVGHVGRLAPEKNLEFLAGAVADFLRRVPRAWFLLVGSGPLEPTLERIFGTRGVAARVRRSGTLEGTALADAYAAMDVFAFASLTETQGMVVTEAMAAGTPVLALDAPGVREVVRDRCNGRLLAEQDMAAYVDALEWLHSRPRAQRRRLCAAASRTAATLSLERCADRALTCYAACRELDFAAARDDGPLTRITSLFAAEWDIVSSNARALNAAVTSTDAGPEPTADGSRS